MSRKSRMQDLRARKDRRMKMIAIGGAVLLAAILAFELPHYLGKSGSQSPATTASASSAASTTAAATGTSGTAAGTAAAVVLPTASTKLENSDVQPTRTKSQLYSFSHFSGKDPFVSQIAATTPKSSTGSTGGTASSAPTSSAPTGVSGSVTAPASVATQANSATIEVNGKIENVPTGSSFPSSNPVFKLVSVSSKAAKIGIANGGFSNGKSTVSVAVGRSLTLVNKTNGRRYVLLLLSVS